jgi:hypothetical protein
VSVYVWVRNLTNVIMCRIKSLLIEMVNGVYESKACIDGAGSFCIGLGCYAYLGIL